MKPEILKKFVLSLPGYHALEEKQQHNVLNLIEVSKKFLQQAGITPRIRESISGNTIILESGHQPNFFPYAGIWKKAFCLNWIRDQLNEDGTTAVAFFGLGDRNLSTARILSKNQIPALNKDGLMKIGYKINEPDRMKSFCQIEKPSRERWQGEIDKIELHYRDLAKKTRCENPDLKNQRDSILELVWSSYERAANAAGLNSVIFAKICSEFLGIDVWFFLYSDMHQKKFFLDESRTILRNTTRFNEIYNRVIAEKALNMPLETPNHIPFWYECECGGKTDLFLKGSNTAEGKCPLCKKDYHLDFGREFHNLDTYYISMTFNAVSRNIAMAHGLGDTLFISGTGGSLHYGRISDRISHELGFHSPVSLAWRSKDYYFGMAHHAAVHELKKQFSLESADFLTPDLNRKIKVTFDRLDQHIRDTESTTNKNDIQRWTGIRSHAHNQVISAKNIFSMTPSFLDILANQDAASIVREWKEVLSGTEMHNENGFYLVQRNITYPAHLLSDIPSDSLPEFYANIHTIEV